MVPTTIIVLHYSKSLKTSKNYHNYQKKIECLSIHLFSNYLNIILI
nr:MAG TPA: hypothetical protein [Caudoviricetes sp.]